MTSEEVDALHKQLVTGLVSLATRTVKNQRAGKTPEPDYPTFMTFPFVIGGDDCRLNCILTDKERPMEVRVFTKDNSIFSRVFETESLGELAVYIGGFLDALNPTLMPMPVRKS